VSSRTFTEDSAASVENTLEKEHFLMASETRSRASYIHGKCSHNDPNNTAVSAHTSNLLWIRPLVHHPGHVMQLVHIFHRHQLLNGGPFLGVKLLVLQQSKQAVARMWISEVKVSIKMVIHKDRIKHVSMSRSA